MADKIVTHPGDSSIKIRFVDQGDGTYIEKVTATGMVTKTVRSPLDASVIVGYVDQGDGTFAERVSVGGGGGSSLISTTATADETLAARSLVYVKSTGNCALANATAEGKEAVGFVAVGVASGAVATIFLVANIIPGLTGLTPGAAYYLSASTPGGIVNLAGAPATTGNVLQKVGTALSTTTLVFDPETPITL